MRIDRVDPRRLSCVARWVAGGRSWARRLTGQQSAPFIGIGAKTVSDHLVVYIARDLEGLELGLCLGVGACCVHENGGYA